MSIESKKLFEDLFKEINSLRKSIQKSLPFLESEVDQLIKSETTDNSTIEYYLDRLLSLAEFGIADDLFIKLLEYYKGISPKEATYYQDRYEA